MRIVKMIMVMASVVVALSAQENTTPTLAKADNPEAVVIPVKSLTGDSFSRLVKLLTVFNARFTSDDKLRIIVIYAPKDIVAQMRKVIADLDRPGSLAAIGRNIDMVMSFLKCSTKTASSMASLPADLEAVGKQLRIATTCKDVQLWETLPLHLQEGKESSQTARVPVTLPDVTGAGAVLQVRLMPDSVVVKDTGRYVRFERLMIDMRIPVLVNKSTGAYNMQEIGFHTSGEFKEGQKSVIGKMPGVDEDTSVFVVISVKVQD